MGPRSVSCCRWWDIWLGSWLGIFGVSWLGAALAQAVAAVSTHDSPVATVCEACSIVAAVASGFLAVACYVVLQRL
jgi:hypothetical protein